MNTITVTSGGQITLLNASYEVLSERVTMQKAARLLSLGKAVIEEADPHRSLGSWAYPKVIRLVKFVKIAYDKVYGPPMVSKRNVLRRDKYTCAYCGNEAGTIDHIHPRSRGGGNTWMNMVAACQPCNNRKDDRTPREAKMVLMWEPFIPTKSQVK